ncbi:MAG: MgtC/SapB family protein [Lachnospiraceae bacterium]|nr:MgtC/SapB family protein [Lachnospiraceae bacterium]
MKNIMDVLYYLEEFNEVSVAVRLILATIMGGIIGMERGATRHAAGLRTFILVCVGAALAQIVNIHLVLTYGTGDPVRLAQGVINGIGFLGVGTIVVTGSSHIKGLTTAATLWTTAVLGISIGSGYIYSSVITFALIMVAIKLMAGFSRKQMLHNRILQVKIEVSGDSGIKNIVEYLHKHGYRITEIDKRRNDDKILLGMDIDLGKKINHDGVIEEIYGLDDVDFVMEIF